MMPKRIWRSRIWRERMRRERPARLHALVLVALVALGGMVAVPRLDSAPPTPTTLLVLGDSLTWGANYFAKAERRLAETGTFDTVVVDGWWSRRIGGIISTTYSGANTYKKLTKDGLRPTAVIVALGTNDVYFLAKKREFAAIIRELMDAIGPLPVVWLNVHRVESATTITRSRIFNTTLGKVLADYPNASVYDWVATVEKNPSLMAFDKIHLQPSGYEARTRAYLTLASELAQRASDLTSTTTTRAQSWRCSCTMCAYSREKPCS
ncbi:MAG: SGNH/GDSL hydrolase family protein [Actinobacteria bacterium]|nr:SGNH/GDSL hydrolase family protein [Actinomycetota bacterium]